MGRVRVLIATSDATVGATARDALEGVPVVQVVAEARDLEDATRSARDDRPDLILLDPRLVPAAGGVDRIAQLCRSDDIVILSPAAAHLITTIGAPAADLQFRRSRFGLTARETDVVELICAGAANREIALELRIAPKTVKNHVGRLFAKLGASTRTEAMATWLGLRGAGPESDAARPATGPR